MVKFFSKQVGSFREELEFENFWGLKKQNVVVESRSDFPNIVTTPKSMFPSLKRSRVTSAPECYLSKKFVISENLFDFGPLLIGKAMANRHDPAVTATNSETFRIVNVGKFDCELEFSFASDVIQSDLQKAGVFKVEPESMTVKGNGECQEIRVFALP